MRHDDPTDDGTPVQELLDRFRRHWRFLSQLGCCDALDGAEYKRVLGKWAAGGCDDDIRAFIRREANRPPS